jgi:hypothetical protein
MPPREPVLVCRGCSPSGAGTVLSPEAMTFLTGATAVAPEQLRELPLGARAAIELETAHRRLLNMHLEKELKSARVLREMRQVR